MREVYRKLASAMHPDRETDPDERERKTVLMQRVNHAYGQRNLLELLQLQLELEHIDASTLNTLTADRLKHYNRVLTEQLDELKQEVFDQEQGFKLQFNLDPFDKLTLANLPRFYQYQLDSVLNDIQELILLGEEPNYPKSLKAWLKEQRDYEREMEKALDDDSFFDDPFFR